MDDILHTDDALLIAAIEPLLRAENIRFFIADRHMAGLGFSLGLAPRRLMVHEDDAARARQLIVEAGYGAELRQDKATWRTPKSTYSSTAR
jgi:hypothetical protein